MRTGIRLSHRIGMGYVVMSMLLGFCGGTGVLGLAHLEYALDYITGAAWETADGSMETRVSVQNQMIAASNVVANVKVEEYSRLLAEARDKARYASERVIQAGVISASQQAELKQNLDAYERELEAMLASYAEFAASRQAFDDHTDRFALLMNQIEDLGGADVEGLVQEARVGFLELLYYVQRMTEGQDLALDGINTALVKQEDAANRIAFSAVFDLPANMEDYPGMSVAQVYAVMFDEHKRLLANYVDRFTVFQQANQGYEETTSLFLGFLETVEDVGDRALEGEVETVNMSKKMTRQVVWLTTVCGMIVSMMTGFYLTRSITRPLKIITNAASRVANGDIKQAFEIHSTDEIGELAAALQDVIAYVQDLSSSAARPVAGDELDGLAELLPHSTQAVGLVLYQVFGDYGGDQGFALAWPMPKATGPSSLAYLPATARAPAPNPCKAGTRPTRSVLKKKKPLKRRVKSKSKT